MAETEGSTPDHDALVRCGGRAFAAPFQHVAPPQRAFHIGDQFAVQLLPPQPCAIIEAAHRGDECGWQNARIVLRGSARHHGAFLAQDTFQQRHCARGGGGDGAGIVAQAQAQHEIVPRCLGTTVCTIPFGDFVGPGMAVLRPAQGIGFAGPIQHRAGAAGPVQAAVGGFVIGSGLRRRDGENAALSLHHHPPCIAQRIGDQRNAGARVRFRNATNPFGTSTGLAEPAPGHDRPHLPVAFRRFLCAMRPHRPVGAQQRLALLRKFGERLRALCVGQPDQLALGPDCGLDRVVIFRKRHRGFLLPVRVR